MMLNGKIIKIIQFVIIYSIMILKFHIIGKIINIKILIEVIIIIKHKHYMMHLME